MLESKATSPVGVGDVISGKYLVQAVLGEGAVGVVVRALNVELQETVALKFLRPEMLAQREVVARFAREAKAASSLRCEHVARVFDVGTTSGGAPYLVMEFLEGKDLGAVLRDEGRLEVKAAAEYAMQACEALATAHAKGIIHRDIKPENLFVTSRHGTRFVKVLDFGISKTALTGSMFGTDLPLVKTISLVGTPLYMAPEQVRASDQVDARTDVWAIGMVLYEALTGDIPFTGTNVPQICAEILEKPIPPVTTKRVDVPLGLVDIVAKCLEKDPAKRYQDVAALATALMPFAPRRARICAERAAHALVAAGILERPAAELSSLPPPAGPVEAVTVIPPSAAHQPLPTPAPWTKSTPGPERRATPVGAQVEARGSGTRSILAIGIASVLALTTAIGVLLAIREPTTTGVKPTPAASPVSAEPPPPVETTSAPPPEPPPAVTTAAPLPSPPSPPVRVAPPLAAPPPPPRVEPPKEPPPAPTKKSEDPDLGY